MNTSETHSSRRVLRFAILAAALVCLTTLYCLVAPTLARSPGAFEFQNDEAAEKEFVSKIVGPEATENNCTTCHALEAEAWLQTRHYATFKDRHRSDRAKEILDNLGIRSMKRATECRQCHYTSVVKNDDISPTWGVSCESCHGPAHDWVVIHGKAGGDAAGQTLAWGAGKSESASDRQARLNAAASKGMIHSEMIYDIASNCFGCHTVPNEEIVNKGNHKAGSDFDLVAWSQGEIRHNFVTSPGAPDSPTNRPASAEEKRKRYVVGLLVDLEVSLRNLSNVTETGGAFHTAMIDRVNNARTKLDAVFSAVSLPELAAAVQAVPSPVDQSTSLSAGMSDALGKAARAFATSSNAALDGIDNLLPTEVKGAIYKE